MFVRTAASLHATHTHSTHQSMKNEHYLMTSRFFMCVCMCTCVLCVIVLIRFRRCATSGCGSATCTGARRCARRTTSRRTSGCSSTARPSSTPSCTRASTSDTPTSAACSALVSVLQCCRRGFFSVLDVMCRALTTLCSWVMFFYMCGLIYCM